jgi:hypothetical protein
MPNDCKGPPGEAYLTEIRLQWADFGSDTRAPSHLSLEKYRAD